MLLLVAFAFLGGLITILSPCILPILPIVLSGSLGGGHKRPLGIVTGFVLSFTFFTLFLAALVNAFNIPADTMRNVAIVVIGLMGLSLVIPQTQVLLEKVFSRFSRFAPKTQNSSGFLGGLVVGFSLGLLWTPCVGPILASVITLAITSQVNAAAAVITFAYALGTALPMLLITYTGRQLFQKVPWLLQNTKKIQQGFGVVMILVAVGLAYNVDRRFQTYILETFPEYGTGLTALEDNQVVRQQLDKLQGGEPSSFLPSRSDRLLAEPSTQAPGFAGGGTWLNSEPLTLEELRGQVVLVDFWTYSCINCIRTMPYLRNWWSKYQDQGLVIVGVHSPEFEFEKVTGNVQQAASDFELTYPIVQDNDFNIWRAYNNRYWPAKYLIDQDGYIRYTHFGEGKYAETEQAIRQLLELEPMSETTEEQTARPRRQTPEIYLGYERAEHYSAQNNIAINTAKEYEEINPEILPLHGVALEGNWTVGPESITANANNASLTLRFLAADVFLVLEGNGQVQVLLDGELIQTVQVSQPQKYDLVKTEYGQHLLELRFTEGVSVFAFTFGS